MLADLPAWKLVGVLPLEALVALFFAPIRLLAGSAEPADLPLVLIGLAVEGLARIVDPM